MRVAGGCSSRQDAGMNPIVTQVAEDDEQHGVPADVWSCLDVHPRDGRGDDSSAPAAIGPEVCLLCRF